MVWRFKCVAVCGTGGCNCLYLGCAVGWDVSRNAIIINVVVMLISNA